MIRKILLASVLIIASQFAFAQQAEAEKFQEGVHYFKIAQVPAASDNDEIQVTVVFSYLCSHFNTLDPYVESWAKRQPDNIKLNRIHVDFGGASSMMDAIWKQRKRFRSPEQLADFYADFGVEQDRYLANYNSFALDSQMRRNMQNVQTYGVTGTPAIVVAQKYRVPNTSVIMDVVDYLIAIETTAQPAP